ncbi:hypothetical protein PHSC3_001902 [Chlamydiales bacterium STE3]|nr:hypothetical protein PHSC3_001902 [Chlamydiales bacterium STE3]
MNAIWIAIIYTPLWVYALLIALIINGIQSVRTRTVSLLKLSILPTIFSCLTLQSLFALPLTLSLFLAFLCSTLIGGAVGWKQVEHLPIKIIASKYSVVIPGNWNILVISLLIFATKYGFGYALYQNPSLIEDALFIYTMTIMSGLCTSFFVGRLFCYFHRYKQIAFAQ